MSGSDHEELIAIECADGVLRLALNNRPANLLSIGLMESLLTELDAARDDMSIRVIVIAAVGKLFSAGHDLKEMTSHRSDADEGKAFFMRTFALCSRLMQEIVNHPKPVIAEVDGIATAAGCQLVASCDLALASDRSSFGVNGIDVGLFCSTPAVALTRNISRKRAMEMLLTGEMIDAVTALEFGLVNRIVPSETLADTTNKMARVIAAKAPAAVKLGKQAVLRQTGMDLAHAYEEASRVMVNNLLIADAVEGISAFLEKRSPKWSS
ncbi:MAG TPA: enoyl-CoA hydratase [Sphingomicrobium sp.]|nr:enoyl-CoA hydratase [Sphingomicrobium sp.]